MRGRVLFFLVLVLEPCIAVPRDAALASLTSSDIDMFSTLLSSPSVSLIPKTTELDLKGVESIIRFSKQLGVYDDLKEEWSKPDFREQVTDLTNGVLSGDFPKLETVFSHIIKKASSSESQESLPSMDEMSSLLSVSSKAGYDFPSFSVRELESMLPSQESLQSLLSHHMTTTTTATTLVKDHSVSSATGNSKRAVKVETTALTSVGRSNNLDFHIVDETCVTSEGISFFIDCSEDFSTMAIRSYTQEGCTGTMTETTHASPFVSGTETYTCDSTVTADADHVTVTSYSSSADCTGTYTQITMRAEECVGGSTTSSMIRCDKLIAVIDIHGDSTTCASASKVSYSFSADGTCAADGSESSKVLCHDVDSKSVETVVDEELIFGQHPVLVLGVAALILLGGGFYYSQRNKNKTPPPAVNDSPNTNAPIVA